MDSKTAYRCVTNLFLGFKSIADKEPTSEQVFYLLALAHAILNRFFAIKENEDKFRELSSDINQV